MADPRATRALKRKCAALESSTSALQEENVRLRQQVDELRQRRPKEDNSTPVMSPHGFDHGDTGSVHSEEIPPMEFASDEQPPPVPPAVGAKNQVPKDILSLLSAFCIADLMVVGTIVKLCPRSTNDSIHQLLHHKVGVVIWTKERSATSRGPRVQMFRVQFLTGVTGPVLNSKTKRLQYRPHMTRQCVDFSVTDSPERVCMLRVISRPVPTEGESDQATTGSAYAREVMETLRCESDAADTMALLFIDLCTHAANASILKNPLLATVLNPCQMEIVSALAKFQKYDQEAGIDWKQFRELKRHAHPDRASSWGNYAKQRGWLTGAQVALVVQTMTNTFQAIMERKKQARTSPSGGMFSGGLF